MHALQNDTPGPRFLYAADEAERRHHLSAFGNLPIFETASGAAMELLLSRAEFRRYAPGELLVVEGAPPEAFYVLLAGVVRAILRHERGLEFTSVIFRAPAQFADLAGLSGAPGYGASLEAVTPSVAVAVPMADLQRALDTDHGLCRKWLNSMVQQFAESIRSRRQQFFDDCSDRAAHMLLSYAEAMSDADDGRIDFPLSYAGIARQLGCTRRNAIRIMKELEERGLVCGIEGGWSLDRAKLRERFREAGGTLVHPQQTFERA